MKTILEEKKSASACSIKAPYKLASLALKPEKSVITIGDVTIGGEKIVLMAGPCSIESVEQLVTIGKILKGLGVKILRGSAYKPRTSPYSFQGHGEEGLKMHKEAQKEHGLLIETEVMDVRDIDLVEEHVDILRIGARNMQNYNLLKEVGKCKKPVILKRGLSATVEEWLLSAEYIMSEGNPHVILCERGIRTFEQTTRNTLDLSSVAVAKTLTHLPIIVDPSHAAGRRDIICDLSRAAVAVGADGLLIEVHPSPKESVCDASQTLSPEEFAQLTTEIAKIASAMEGLYDVRTLKKKIDAIDIELVALFAKRLEVAKEIARVKKQQQLPIHDSQREQDIYISLKRVAASYGILPEIIEEIFSLYIKYTKEEMKKENEAL